MKRRSSDAEDAGSHGYNWPKRCLICDNTFLLGWQCPACGFAPVERDGILCFNPEGESTAAAYDDRYFEVLARHEARHFWFRARARLLKWVIRTKAMAVQDYLEVGCGSGAVLTEIAATHKAWNIAAAEPLLEGLRRARGRVPTASLFLQVDATRLPLLGCVDLVGAYDVLEHVDDDVRALRAIRSVLRPGGELLLSVPQHRWLWSQADEFAGHRRRYTREELAAKLQSAGLEVVWSSSFTTLTLPLMWLSRRLARPNADPWREFEILQWMNRILGAVMAVEFAMIRCGLRLPAGGSLLLLARSSPRATENPISADMTTGTDV